MTTLTTIETPERVAFTYDVAGLGTRVIAYLIDLAIRGAALLLMLVAGVALFGQVLSETPSWVPTAAVVVLFLLQWGYLTLFEGLWDGQTPGKRLMGIRVIKEGGYPASFLDAALRNLVRVVDFLPVMYGVGVVCIFFSGRHQRLGDIVAGTLVVRQRETRPASLDEILAAHGEANRRPAGRGARLELPVQEFEAIVEFLERAGGIEAEARSRIAEKFAASVRRRIGASKVLRERYPTEGVDAESLLRQVVGDRREGGEERPAAEGAGK